LTELFWTGRVLGGSSSTGALPISVIWTLTANNATASTDMARRSIPINLDAHTEFPSQRKGPKPAQGWRHADLIGWANEHRPELVRAALILCLAWVQEGMPGKPTHRLGSYEAWEAVIGGVLDVVGVPGFEENLDTFQASADDERDATAEFYRDWRSAYGDEVRTSRVVAESGPDDVRRHLQRDDGRCTAFTVGAFLRTHKDRVSDGMVLRRVDRHHESDGWRVVREG
jgi:putative DNA primase/helicase